MVALKGVSLPIREDIYCPTGLSVEMLRPYNLPWQRPVEPIFISSGCNSKAAVFTHVLLGRKSTI
jgi:hypothetical protein